MAMGIRAILTGSETADTDDAAWMDVERVIRKKYADSKEDKKRRKAARTRRRLYDCGGVDVAFDLIDEVFKDPTVRQLRKELAPFARFDNALRRNVNERARVYAKRPKIRRVDNDTDVHYQWVQKVTQHNQAMRLANVVTTLANDSFWLFRVREMPTGERLPRTDILGPEDFFAIHDPRDRTKLIGVGIDQTPDAIEPRESDPHWLVWTDAESFKTDAVGRIIQSTVQRNPFGRIPGLLVHSDYRATSLLDPITGEDIVAAHLAVWLINTMMLKETKTMNRQAAFIGDMSRTTMGQTQDSERDLLLGEGTSMYTVDRGVDLEKYQKAADHVVERAAANYGIPPSVLRHAGATSGYEIDLRRIPLEELREDQIEIFREAEREYAEVQRIVLEQDLPERSFDTGGWWMDFAEIKRPTPEKEKYETRQLKRRMGHSDPVLELLEDNPDLTPDMAANWVADRMQAFLAFVEAARVRPNVSGDADALEAGGAPAQNGAENTREMSGDDMPMDMQ